MGLDYYSILDIKRDATDLEIEKAYRKLALIYHPERNTDPQASEIFYLIGEAYDVLSSAKTRVLYDQFGEEGFKKGIPLPPGTGELIGPVETYVFHGDPNKVFRDFFGVDNPFAHLYLPNVDPSYRFFERPAKPGHGSDSEFTFSISLEEVFYGCSKTVSVPLKVINEEETMTVEILKKFTFCVPRGCENGNRFTFAKAGNSGPNMIPGNVTFVAELQPHAVYKLEDKNLILPKTIALVHALAGCVVNVNTLDGKVRHLPLTEIVPPGKRIKIEGEGLPVKNSALRGDLIVEFAVTFPQELNSSQRTILREVLTQKTKKLRTCT